MHTGRADSPTKRFQDHVETTGRFSSLSTIRCLGKFPGRHSSRRKSRDNEENRLATLFVTIVADSVSFARRQRRVFFRDLPEESRPLVGLVVLDAARLANPLRSAFSSLQIPTICCVQANFGVAFHRHLQRVLSRTLTHGSLVVLVSCCYSNDRFSQPRKLK